MPLYTQSGAKGLGAPAQALPINESLVHRGMNLDPLFTTMRTLFTLLISMILLQSCQDGQSARPALNTEAAYTLRDVAYGNDTAQRMDVYLPARRSSATTPVMVLVHGGGWTGGNKNDFNSYIESFRRRMPEYAFVNINYRLVNGPVLLDAQRADVRAAIDAVRGKTGEWNVNGRKLVLLGASAGAHLALLEAYSRPGVTAVVDFFGPTDLVAMHEQPWHPLVPLAVQMIMGAPLAQQRAAYEAASPVRLVTAQAPPTLILHGSKDPVVALSQSKALEGRLAEAGVAHELVVYPGAGHGWHGSTLTKSFDVLEKFLEQHVK
ncbi:MAG: alpha/beta hydrolase [Chitinophagaceae bacterium]|nr:MAG: alpha/beta hydrolase [Chitinophagaceae bacterium]